MRDHEFYLLKLREVLTTLKATMHKTADTSTRDEIDKAILLIDQQLDGERIEPKQHKELLLVLGKVFDNLPSIIAFLKLLSG